MDTDTLLFFHAMPGALPCYEALERSIYDRFPEVRKKVSKTQISFSNKYGFAYASLPLRKVKGWPDVCLIVTFGLSYQLEHPRIARSVEPYPNRWTHHVVVETPEEIDDELMGWIADSYSFSLVK